MYVSYKSRSSSILSSNLVPEAVISIRRRLTSSSSFELASRESLGFFNDITDREWLIKKKIAANRKRMILDHKRARFYFQGNFNPDFSCGEAEMVASIGSGGHWICDVWRMNKEGCVVYSVGAGDYNDFPFERALKARAPLCDIHVFDHVDYSATAPKDILTFHQMGLKGADDLNVYIETPQSSGVKDQTLTEIAKELGHDKIDYLKMDYDTAEYAYYEDFTNKLNVRQLTVMYHDLYHISPTSKERSGSKTTEVFENIHKAGYVIFHKESDLSAKARHIEFSFLKLHPSFQEQSA